VVDSARCLVSGDGADGKGCGVRGSRVKGWGASGHKEIRQH